MKNNRLAYEQLGAAVQSLLQAGGSEQELLRLLPTVALAELTVEEGSLQPDPLVAFLLEASWDPEILLSDFYASLGVLSGPGTDQNLTLGVIAVVLGRKFAVMTQAKGATVEALPLMKQLEAVYVALILNKDQSGAETMFELTSDAVYAAERLMSQWETLNRA